jgi:hypothetical protein
MRTSDLDKSISATKMISAVLAAAHRPDSWVWTHCEEHADKLVYCTELSELRASPSGGFTDPWGQECNMGDFEARRNIEGEITQWESSGLATPAGVPVQLIIFND